MKAIILAAGLSSRLHPLTLEIPKCLLPLHGKTVMEHQLGALASAGISDVTVIVGFLADVVRQSIGDRVDYARYERFRETNNLGTLHHCRKLLDDDCLVLFADVLLAADALSRLARHPADFALLVDRTRVLENTMRIQTESGGIVDLGGHIPAREGEGNFVGIAKYSKAGAVALADELEAMIAEGGHEDKYYVQALPRLVKKGAVIEPVDIHAPWLEIDTNAEYEAAIKADFYLSGASSDEPGPGT
ncbi:MAG: phosphocholine cytidylyltransferase family protein [Rhodospirillales bacterium]